MAWLYVALGGGMGACLRYLIGLIPFKSGFPVNTFIANILGCILLGYIAGQNSSNQNFNLFWKAGVCGGFTTFSTFSLESIQLFDKKDFLLAICYMLLSLLCCLGGIISGKKLAALI